MKTYSILQDPLNSQPKKKKFDFSGEIFRLVTIITLISGALWTLKFMLVSFAITTLLITLPQSIAAHRACEHFYPGSFATGSFGTTACWKTDPKAQSANHEAVKIGEVQYQITDDDIKAANVEANHYREIPWYSLDIFQIKK